LLVNNELTVFHCEFVINAFKKEEENEKEKIVKTTNKKRNSLII